MEALRKDFGSKIRKLQSYAQEGKWHNVLEFAGHYKAAAAAAQDSTATQRWQQAENPTPDDDELQGVLQEELHAELAYATFKVQALVRLKKFSAAGDELAQLGDLPEQQLSGARSSACVPFGLLYLRAQLPACMGSPHLTIDLLYELRSYCQQQLQHGVQGFQQQQQHDVQEHDQDHDQQHNTETAAAAAAAWVALWQHRLRGVTCSLISHYWRQGSVAAAFQLLDDLLQQQPDDVAIWSLAGRLQLQLNLLQQAYHSFTKVQELVQQQQQHLAGATDMLQQQQQHQLIHHNWGCFHALTKNMTAALTEFDQVQQLSTAAAAAQPSDPLAAAVAGSVDTVALSNAAVCMLHMGQLTEAISALEAGLQQHPVLLTQECSLFNLGLLYDLAYRDAAAKQARHTVANWALRVMPDDMDLACIEPA